MAQTRCTGHLQVQRVKPTHEALTGKKVCPIMSSNCLMWDGASDGISTQAVSDWYTECELQDRQHFFLPFLLFQAWNILLRGGFPLKVSLHHLKMFLFFFQIFLLSESRPLRIFYGFFNGFQFFFLVLMALLQSSAHRIPSKAGTWRGYCVTPCLLGCGSQQCVARGLPSLCSVLSSMQWTSG